MEPHHEHSHALNGRKNPRKWEGMKNKLEIDDKRSKGTGPLLIGVYDQFMSDWGRDAGRCDHSIALWACSISGKATTEAKVSKLQKGVKQIRFKSVEHAERILGEAYDGHVHVSIYDGESGEAS